MTTLFIIIAVILLFIILVRPTHIEQNSGKWHDYLLTQLLVRKSHMISLFNSRTVDHNGPYADVPDFLIAFCWLKVPLFIWRHLILTGGGCSKCRTTIWCFRFHINFIDRMITEAAVEPLVTTIPLYLMAPDGINKISDIPIDKSIKEPYLDKVSYNTIDDDIQKMINKEIVKTGALLYGPPGNGKSYLIRHLAVKHKLPIYIIGIDQKMTNISLLTQFNSIASPSIVLFEDFDCLFNKKERDPNNMSMFTLDTLLNIFDGTHCQLDGVAIFITANNINRIDESLRWRPSRLKFVQEISNPSEEIRSEIFENDEQLISLTDGFNLDECLAIKERGIEAVEEIVNQRHPKDTKLVGFGISGR